MANIGSPKFSLRFKGLGVSAITRGSKGYCALIIKDDTSKTFTTKEYTSIEELTSAEQALYTPDNLLVIKDALEGTPKKLFIFRMDATGGVLADTLKIVKGKIPRNCWIGIYSSAQQDQDDLASFTKSSNANDKKRYKALVYKATVIDDIHIINMTNPSFTFKDTRGKQTGDKSLPWWLGLLAGLSLNMSVVGKAIDKFESVEEVVNTEDAINNGEFVCYNDEGKIRVSRGVNSLKTTGTGITDDMKFILIVEVMDMIYTDIYETWRDFYKGKYKNNADYQALFIGAINAYYEGLENSLLLDKSYANKAMVDIAAQRLANIPKYGKDEVDSWDDDKAKEMTFATNVFTKSNIKILNAMEDFDMTNYM